MGRSLFTLAELLGIVVLATLGVATVLLGIWPTAAFSLMLGALAVASLGIVFRHGAARAFCVGFAFFGAAYLIIALAPWFESVSQQLVTSRLIASIHRSVDPELAAEAALRRALDKPAYFEFDETQLHTVAEFIERGYDINVQLHQSVQDKLGIEAPVMYVAHGIPLRSALKNMLVQLDATYWIANGSLFIGTESAWRRGVKIAPTTDPRVAATVRRGGHSLFALLLAFLGGLLGRYLYTTRDTATGRLQLSATKVAAAACTIGCSYCSAAGTIAPSRDSMQRRLLRNAKHWKQPPARFSSQASWRKSSKLTIS